MLSFIKTKLPNRSLYLTMVLYYSMLSISSLVVFGGIMFYIFSNTMRSDTLSHSLKISSQTSMSLDNYFKDIVTSLEMVSTNPIVISSLLDYNTNSSYTNNANRKQIADLLQNTKSLKPDISNIFIYNPSLYFSIPNLTSINVNSPFLNQVWNSLVDMDHTKSIFYPTHTLDYYSNPRDQNVVSMSFPIRDISRFSKTNLAICFVDFNFEKIAQIIEHSKLGKSDSIILLSDDGIVIYSTDPRFKEGSNELGGLYVEQILQQDTGSYNTTFHSEKLQVNYSTSKVTGWKLVYLSKLSEIQKNVDRTGTITLYLVFTVIVLSIAMSIFISRRSSKPIIKLMKNMQEVGRGNFTARIPEDEIYSEFRILNSGFNMMTNKINVLFDEVYTGKIKQREAEFKALQSNIHPHFLNNTLQVIHSLAILERTSDIEKVVTALGNLLEYTIYQKETNVLIFKELDYINDYLQIQNIRYDNTIQVDIEVEEKVSRSYILKFLLQPLIENAIYHGLDKIAKERVLSIRGYTADGNIYFEIMDNGIGMTEQQLFAVIQNLEQKVVPETSIGLSNVQERIQIAYGQEYGIKVHSEYGKGTKLVVVIPING
ncbi:HAMP domain-containing protein [Paenibacillus sp. LMG 31460]|uniref:histidine kinase n=2 Tax=Paenibacillus germinis TaxID=2654979 RepID=A0ABX1Z4G9_9BACL|nr:HAMP domain-containing protein [Paenibacillus germinis]